MLARPSMPEASGEFQVPLVAYYIIRIVHALTPGFVRLGRLETEWIRLRRERTIIDRPVYICGFPLHIWVSLG